MSPNFKHCFQGREQYSLKKNSNEILGKNTEMFAPSFRNVMCLRLPFGVEVLEISHECLVCVQVRLCVHFNMNIIVWFIKSVTFNKRQRKVQMKVL